MKTLSMTKLRTALGVILVTVFTASAAHAADLIQVSVKNNWDKTIEVYIYNGDDKTRWSTKQDFYVEKGETESGYCNGQGKGRCYVRIRKIRGNNPAETKWGGWVDRNQVCTVPANASGARWDEVKCK